MENITPLVFGLFFLVSFLFVRLMPAKQGWKGLLLSSLGFYYLLFDYKVLLLLTLAFFLYHAAFHIHKNGKKLKYAVLLFLAPLIIEKIINNSLHFDPTPVDPVTLVTGFRWQDLFTLVGLSYFTFNGLSYIIDVRRKYIEPERNFGLLLLYLVWFPALLSGPLHRYKYLKAQFENVTITEENISKGLRLILWGFFKNMVIAQRLFYLFASMMAHEVAGISSVLMGLTFFLYLFFNFSSFIDIVQGISQLFNIRLKNNFQQRVYLSSSRLSFWKGWHITLNEWFRDYFFFSLAKHDKQKRYTDLILLLTFLLIALWHGLTPVLFVWGMLNGTWIILERKISMPQSIPPRLLRIIGVPYHLFFAGVLALIFISPDILQTAEQLFVKPNHLPLDFLVKQGKNLVILLVAILLMDYFSAKAKDRRMDDYFQSFPGLKRWLVYLLLIGFILFFGLSGSIANYYIRF